MSPTVQNASTPANRRGVPPWVFPFLGYAIAILCLVVVYQKFDWRQEFERVQRLDWRWVTVAVAADITVYIVQGFRWSVLLSPVVVIPVWRAIQAIYIGLFANEVLPLRTGEVIRCYLVGRWARIPFAKAVSSGLIERVFDGVWLLAGFLLVTQLIQVHAYLVVGSYAVAAILLVAGALVLWAIRHKEHARDSFRESRWREALHHLVDGLHDMGNSRTFYTSGFLSLVYLALQVVPIYGLMRAYGLDLGWSAAIATMVILRLGSVPPQAPGNIGLFQFLAAESLKLQGIDSQTATGFATVLFFLVTGPLWMVGLLCLLATRMKLSDIRAEAEKQQAGNATP